MDRIRPDDCRAILKDLMLRNTPPRSGSAAMPVQGLLFHRQHGPEDPMPHFFEPVVILVAQGTKLVRIGEEERLFGENVCFVSGIDLPVSSCVADASPERPYLALSLALDMGLIAALSAEMPPLRPPPDGSAPDLRAVATHEADPELLDAFVRLAEIAEHPTLAPLLGEALTREIHCRLLLGPFGCALREFNTGGTRSGQIMRVLAWLKENYEKPLAVAELARRANMAPSTFHKYFKEITAMSPLQYQKRLRLDAARRLLLSGRDVTGAALEVGYESVSQFGREYKRLFGEPPKRHIAAARAALFHSPDRTG